MVVEHDEDTIRRADHIIDIGPGAGKRGGRVVAQGSAQDLIDAPESVTGRYLAKPLQHPLQGRRPVEADTPMIEIKGARLHNLRSVDAKIPVGRLSVVTGVSGSGKSTLARDVLLDNLMQAVSQGKAPGWAGCESIKGWEADRPRAGSGPDADRQDAALVPGDLHRLLGRRSASCSPTRAKRACAAMDLGALLVQHRRRPLPGLRRPGHAHHRDELPARREGAVRRLPRRALQSARRWR